jgi:RNA polymerase sigma-70 factor, ECF subfamily
MPERAAASDLSGGLSADSADVYAEFHRRLHAFVSRRVRNAADAEDIVQDTFLRIHRHLAQVRAVDRLAAWVFQVARSALVDHFRRQRPPSDAMSEDHESSAMPDAARSAESPSDFAELAACLAPMIESLPPADREAIDLSEIKGLTQREASTRVGVTLSGMKSRVQRARRKLKEMLLDCCRIELDRRGGIVGHEPRDRACEPCRPGSPSRPGSMGSPRKRKCAS